MSDFTHLHVHTDASRIDGLGTVSRIVNSARMLGFKSLAMTDHGTLANAISFNAAAEVAGIKPIIGMEGYVRQDGKRFHITLLADGPRGFSSLVKLNNKGAESDDTTRPTFAFSDLLMHNEGLIVLTGCSASPFQHEVHWDDARQLALELKSAIGNRLMAEVMFVGNAGGHWERAAKLARDLKLAPVLTNDVHFSYPQDAEVQKLLTTIKSGFTYENRYLYLASEEEIRRRVEELAPDFLSLFEQGVINAGKLAARLGTVNFKSPAALPHIDDAYEKLVHLVQSGLGRKVTPADMPRYIERAQEELNVIEGMGFSSYFLILQDIIAYARSIGVRVGPGRGSGAGSLVLWAIECTEIDPLVYGLSFERFLNKHRKEMPDVDTDFDSEGRDQVIAYANRRWGAIPVATYQRWSHKSLVHDLSRVLRIPRSVDDEIADEEAPGGPAFMRASTRWPIFPIAYNAMEGQIKSIGKHPGGVVIPAGGKEIPLERTSNGVLAAAWTEGEYRELTTAGIVKLDLLGISALTILKELEQEFGRRAPDPEDDSPVFRIFQEGDVGGIFQFSGSAGIIRFTKDVKPRTFNDLVAINALWRPGAIDAGTALLYPAWRAKPRTIHPIIDDILYETYGVICYQEQFMAIYARLTGKTLAEADIARKVLAKARPGQSDWEEAHSALRNEFVDGAQDHGLDKTQAAKLWGEIDKHTRYSFNKSHSVAYARIAWEQAWWKFHHRAHFYTALLNSDSADWQNVIHEAISSGMEVKLPHVNRSTKSFGTDGKTIYLPLTVIRGLGDAKAEEIALNAPYDSIDDFLARVSRRTANATIRKLLLKVGAFEGMPGELSPSDFVDMIDGDSDEEDLSNILTIFLPSPGLIRRINKAEEDGYVAGKVMSVETRSSKYGDYDVVVLFPKGSYWTRSYKLSVGDEVRMSVKKDSGKILNVSPL
jgi:DNA polymerase III subunit alpha